MDIRNFNFIAEYFSEMKDIIYLSNSETILLCILLDKADT